MKSVLRANLCYVLKAFSFLNWVEAYKFCSGNKVTFITLPSHVPNRVNVDSSSQLCIGSYKVAESLSLLSY